MGKTRTAIRSPAETSVQSHTVQLEAELSAVRQLAGIMAAIRKMKSQTPQLFDKFKAELHAAVEEEPREPEPAVIATAKGMDADPEWGIEKLVAFFRGRNNEPATIKEMAAGVGRHTKTIKSIIYDRHRGKIVPTEKAREKQPCILSLG